MEIIININDDCKSCKEGLGYLQELQRQHKKTYANLDMETWKFVDGIYLNPDYNSQGHLTHFHISKADNESLKNIIKGNKRQEKDSKVILNTIKQRQKKKNETKR